MTRKIKKLALFLPSPSPFYISLFFAMKRGFQQAGFQVVGWPQLLENDPLLEFCRQYKPDVIFEMNRSRAQIPYLPSNIIHVGWIVDLLGYPFEYFKDSEILYLFGANWVERYYKHWDHLYHTPPDGLIEWMPPGFSPDIYFHAPMEPIVDFSFIGHIPLPWNSNELDRIIWNNHDQSLTFGDFYESCKKPSCISDLYKLGEKILTQIVGEEVELNNRILRYDINCRIGRMLTRQAMMDCILSATKSIGIYGPENWRYWPEYKFYYKKFLSDPHDIRKVFLTSRLNVHEGNGAHFRTFDCMGTGGCIFYHKSPHRESKTNGLEAFFEENKHYVLFEKDNIKEKAAYYLKNSKARKKIGQAANKLVHAKHKWSDRAAKLVKDLKSL